MSMPTEDLGLQILLKNLKKKELVTDVSNIDYTKGEQLLSNLKIPLTSITEAFCDSVVMVKICNKSDWAYAIPTFCHDYLECEFLKLTSESFCCLTPCNEVPISLQETTSRVMGARRIVQNKGIAEKYKDPVCVFYRVDLANNDLKTLLEKMPGILKTVEEKDFFLLEFNITQDFAGIFNKIEMNDYLKSNFNSIVFVKEEEKDDDREIKEDDEIMGIDCLTWTDSNSRIKIYNKFICEMTNSGVRRQVNNTIVDFIDCPSKRMKRIYSSEMAQKHGIVRLDVTIYNYPIDEPVQDFNPLTVCEIFLNKNIAYLVNSPTYSVSIAKMWQKLTDRLQNSCCVVCGNTLQFVYWVSSITEHLTGIEVELPRERMERKKEIDYAITKFGFNGLPINFLEITGDKNLVTKSYLKYGETFFTRSNTLKATISPDIDIHGSGLIHTAHVIAQVQRTSSIKTIMPTFEGSNLRLPDEIIQPMNVDDSKEEEIKPLLMEDLNLFSSAQEWKYLSEWSEYVLYAFAIKEGPHYLQVLGLAKEKGADQKDIYRIQGFENEQLKNIYRTLPRVGYETMNVNDLTVIYAENKQHIAKVFSGQKSDYFGVKYIKCQIYLV